MAERPTFGHAGAKTDFAAQAAPSDPLSVRLPPREERIRLVGKRALATPELKDKLKKLAPTYPASGESANEAIVRLEKAVSAIDAEAISRIERRLALVERSASSLEERQAHAPAEAQPDGTENPEISKLADRLAASEKLQRDTMLKMMAEIRDASRRVDALERARLLAAHEESAKDWRPDNQAQPTPDAEDAASQASEELDAEAPEATENAPEARESAPELTKKSPDYLSNARRAAMSAVSSQLATESPDHITKRLGNHTRVVVGAIAVVVLALTGASLLLRHNTTQAKPVAEHHTSIRLGEGARSHSAALTPTDRLAAEAKEGNPSAELAVGEKYLSGDGIPKNETEAAGWIARAALKGDVTAEFLLASLYEHGRGVASDPVQAFAWYEKAALAGNPKAMHNLAVAYAQGNGVAKDMSEAARWFSRAASLGYVDSAFNLAVLYERGDGVPQSLLDAYKWYAIAAAAGDEESKTRMSAIESELPPDAIAAAQNAAQAFKAQKAPSDATAATTPAPTAR
jgi:TPR repeat protein